MKTVLYLTVLLGGYLHAAEWIPMFDGPGTQVEQLLAPDSNLFALTETGIWKCPKGGDWYP
jgi:hypothetical protein